MTEEAFNALKSELTKGHESFSSGNHAMVAKSFQNVESAEMYSDALNEGASMDLKAMAFNKSADEADLKELKKKEQQAEKAASSQASTAVAVGAGGASAAASDATSEAGDMPNSGKKEKADPMSTRVRKHGVCIREHANKVGAFKLAAKQAIDAKFHKDVDSTADKEFLANLNQRVELTLEVIGMRVKTGTQAEFEPKYPNEAGNDEVLQPMFMDLGMLCPVEKPTQCWTTWKAKKHINTLLACSTIEDIDKITGEFGYVKTAWDQLLRSLKRSLSDLQANVKERASAKKRAEQAEMKQKQKEEEDAKKRREKENTEASQRAAASGSLTTIFTTELKQDKTTTIRTFDDDAEYRNNMKTIEYDVPFVITHSQQVVDFMSDNSCQNVIDRFKGLFGRSLSSNKDCSCSAAYIGWLVPFLSD